MSMPIPAAGNLEEMDDDCILKCPATSTSVTPESDVGESGGDGDAFVFKRPATPPQLKKLNAEYAERAPIELPKIFQNRPASLLTLSVDLTKASDKVEKERDSLGVFNKVLEKMEMTGRTEERRYFRFLGIWSVLNARHNGPRHPARDKLINDIRNKMDPRTSNDSSVTPSFTPYQKRRFNAVLIAYKFLSYNLGIPKRVKDAMRREPKMVAATPPPLLLPETVSSTSTSATAACAPCVNNYKPTPPNTGDIEVVYLSSSSESESEEEMES